MAVTTLLHELVKKPVTDFSPLASYGQVNLAALVQALAPAQRNAAVVEKVNGIAAFLNQYALQQISARTGRPRKAPTGSHAKGYIVQLHNCNPAMALTVNEVAAATGNSPQAIYNKLSKQGAGGAWVHFGTTDEHGNPAYNSVRRATPEEINSYLAVKHE